MYSATTLLFISFLLVLSSLSAGTAIDILAVSKRADDDINSNTGSVINLRIEGSNTTIFEGPIFTRGHVVDTPSGGAHQCNGLNNHSNPTAGPTATSALDDASHFAHFPFDGTFDADLDDFFITSIGPDTQTSTQFWGLLLNFQFTLVGGCQQEVKNDDHVLWAFDAFNANAFLKLTGPLIVAKGRATTFVVTDGQAGVAIQDASVQGHLTNENGHVSITFISAGLQTLKATKATAIRSNTLSVFVV